MADKYNYNSAQYAADFEQGRLDKWLSKHARVADSAPSITEPAEPCIDVNLSSLPAAKQRPVWEWIKANQPGLAQLLSQDATFKELKATFDASVSVSLPKSVCRELGLIKY